MIQIRPLDYEQMKGKRYCAKVESNQCLTIEPNGTGFTLAWIPCDPPAEKTLSDEMLSAWLENPSAYGAYDGDELIGFVEGFLEVWNNRFRISNICVFSSERRRTGTGQLLLNAIMADAVKSGARMAVLETQSFNRKAILFYQKNGFELIGFDRYAYSNDGPAERNMRIEMGRKL